MKKIIVINGLFIFVLLALNFWYLTYRIPSVTKIDLKESVNKNPSDQWIEDITKGILKNDPKLYAAAATNLVRHGSFEKIFFYSTVMALEHQYFRAYWDVYLILDVAFLNRYDEKPSNELYNFMLYNLAKSNELGRKLDPDEILKIKDKDGKILHSNYFLEQMKVK